jgi:hypothetical protein
MRLTTIAAILAASLALSGPVLADEIEDSIKEALTAYEKKDFSAAKHALDYASQLIAQKNAEGLGAALPEPLSGWSAEDVETQDASVAMFGGIRAGRNYARGDERVSLQILGDSPLLSTWMPMMANPAMAAAMGKMTKVGKYRAIQTKDGQVIVVVANRFLVMVDGSASIKDKVDYAAAIDFEKLESL